MFSEGVFEFAKLDESHSGILLEVEAEKGLSTRFHCCVQFHFNTEH